MKKKPDFQVGKTLSSIIMLIGLSLCGKAQVNQAYYDSLLLVIEQDTDLKDAELKTYYFIGGKLKSQELYAKREKESSWYLFRPGIVERFCRNGQLKYRGECSTNTRMISARKYYKNGQPKEVRDYGFEPSFDTADLIVQVSDIIPLQGWNEVHYYRNGTKKSEGYYYQTLVNQHQRQSLKHGVHVLYDKHGDLKKEVTFLKGEGD